MVCNPFSDGEHGLISENVRRGEGHTLALLIHGLDDALNTVPIVDDNGGAGRTVDVALAFLVIQIDALAMVNYRAGSFPTAVNHGFLMGDSIHLIILPSGLGLILI